MNVVKVGAKISVFRASRNKQRLEDRRFLLEAKVMHPEYDYHIFPSYYYSK